MKKLIKTSLMGLLAALFLCGCSLQTADDMYAIPKRSEDYLNLQTAIDSAMADLSYCAPLTGENQQPVQMADLDGDGTEEYLVFARGSDERPLRIFIFRKEKGAYVHAQTVESSGTAFDLVEYVQLDNRPGLEILIGCQVSDQVSRSMTAYAMEQDGLRQLMTAGYTKMLSVDMEGNGTSQILLIRPGATDIHKGVVTLYSVASGSVERSNEAELSQPADKIKRMVAGKLEDGTPAVYIGSMADETTLMTDIFACKKGLLTNVTLSAETGTSVKTMRNYYVYADDIDDDGVVELPSLMSMRPLSALSFGNQHHLIRWYAMTVDGKEADKLYTFHNFSDGWYLQLEKALAQRLTVNILGNEYRFFQWNADGSDARLLLTITVHTGQSRLEQENKIVLCRTDTAVYTATLAPGAEEYGLTRETMLENFRLIRLDWKTGET